MCMVNIYMLIALRCIHTVLRTYLTPLAAKACSSSAAFDAKAARLAIAPVKAPFSCPNNSLASRFSGIAAQLIATNGPSAFGPFA